MSTQVLPLGTLNLPPEWVDQSSYQFVGPAEQNLGIAHLAAHGAHVQPPQPIVTAKRIGLSRDDTLIEYVTNAFALLRRTTNQFVEVEETPWIHPVLGPRLTVGCAYEVVPGQRIKQVQVYLETSRPSVVIGFSFAAAASSFERHRATFRAVFDSFVPDDPR